MAVVPSGTAAGAAIHHQSRPVEMRGDSWAGRDNGDSPLARQDLGWEEGLVWGAGDGGQPLLTSIGPPARAVLGAGQAPWLSGCTPGGPPRRTPAPRAARPGHTTFRSTQPGPRAPCSPLLSWADGLAGGLGRETHRHLSVMAPGGTREGGRREPERPAVPACRQLSSSCPFWGLIAPACPAVPGACIPCPLGKP